ncbi:aldose 1-epimerase family protein [Frigoribacterium sp. CFBP 8766]|uniref:aldose 1-epimerase family protein n=1 Tax=Frigoribacterium sp. CFBP 8766 TaxID=2775273 RepID=UPI001781C8D7|nr:aldose 1-epimerase family protein [Frigoribacterium sp. CFBP 8766]MBD8583443.1 aldose 1-epimerase family protein [Frigoribacterium sp. CFBP 8766]
MTTPPTGHQHELRLEADGRVVTATVTEVAAGLRALAVDGEALTETFAEDETPPSACGITLFPWPNRVDGGRWTLDGRELQLDLTEPAKGNASHGLLRYTAYRAVDVEPHAVTLAATAFPQHGWPFTLETTVRHELIADGMRVVHTVSNVGAARAPFAVGSHPFLRVGEHDPATLTITLEAATRYEVSERGIPTGTSPVAGTSADLRGGPRLGDLDLDTPYRDVQPGADGVRRTRLAAPDGTATELWQDEAFPYVQVFTPRNFPRAGVEGLAVAVEPMTAPPNALATGEGLLWLEPGERWTAAWGIRRLAAGADADAADGPADAGDRA